MFPKNALRYTCFFIAGLAVAALLYETVFVERTRIAILPDNGAYQGEYENGLMHGQGRLLWPDGVSYTGEFQEGRMTGLGVWEDPRREIRYEGSFESALFHGEGEFSGYGEHYKGEFAGSLYHGRGELTFKNGDVYAGEFKDGEMHGEGSYTVEHFGRYEGEFVQGVFSGRGMLTLDSGQVFKGMFLDWEANGPGEIRTVEGERWVGDFKDNLLDGEGEYFGADGAHYKGGFRRNLYHGDGAYTLANGDRYEGSFRWGDYDGPGELTLAAPLDGPEKLAGVWDSGELIEASADTKFNTRSVLTEKSLYNQNALLAAQSAALREGNPGEIDLYFMGLAGYGAEAVFRREVLFTKNYFEQALGTKGRSVALINDRSTIDQYPLVTATSLQRSLQALAQKMDTDEDILFLFLTSHGSEEHEFVLQQPGMVIRDLSAELLADSLRKSGIRWKVVVVSSCYSGGHIDTLADERTLVITASAADKTSFGCDNAAQFTYFGEALFKNALPQSTSFVEAFEKARLEVSKREQSEDYEQSEPQISKPAAILAQLKRWRAQSGG